MKTKNIILGLILAASFNAYAYTVKAFWTGESKTVQTVTYQMVTSCKYQYNGQEFWKNFESGSCPSSIDIE